MFQRVTTMVAILTVGVSLGLISGVVSTPSAQAADEVFIPLLTYRTGAYAPSGIPSANGIADYFKLLNAQGGIDGVKIAWEECETQYNTKRGVECYEKLKNTDGGALLVNPYSTGITYQLIPKASVDKVVIHSMGYGQTAAADGRVFPWVFNFPTTYWSQASAFVRYVGQQEGGMDQLKGKRITLVYHNSAYGREPISTLKALEDKYGFKLTTLSVDHPGQEQKATWLQVRRRRPHWVFMWGWGVMNQVAIREAAAIGYPMDHFIGVWWSGSEADVRPAGKDAVGYKSGTFHGAGTNYAVLDRILKHVYGGDLASAKAKNFGEVLYNRGVVNAMYNTEAIRTAIAKYGKGSLKGEHTRWGFENLNITSQRLGELGMDGFVRPIQITCADHEGGGPVRIQQWDGEKWNFVSDWIDPLSDVVRPLVEEAAAKYAKENNITPRSCS